MGPDKHEQRHCDTTKNQDRLIPRHLANPFGRDNSLEGLTDAFQPRSTSRTSPIAKKGAQQTAGAPFLDPAVNFRPVMGGRLVEQARAMLDCPAFWIVGAEIEPAQAGQGDRGRAHRARLEGNVEIALGEMRGAEPCCAGAQDQHLGVRGRIAIALDPVARGGEKAALASASARATSIGEGLIVIRRASAGSAPGWQSAAVSRAA